VSQRKFYGWSSVAENFTRYTNYDAGKTLFGLPGVVIRVEYPRCEMRSAGSFQGLVPFSGEHGTEPLGSKKD